MTILLLEDDVKQLRKRLTILRNAGFVCRGFEDTDRALEFLSREAVVAFVCDLNVEGSINGWEFAERVADEFKVPDERFVFISGWPHLLKECPARFQSNHRFQKPLDEAEFEKVVAILHGFIEGASNE